MFLSSKKISQLVTVFKQIQNSETVKTGEEHLKVLRQTEDYELGLATFLTRSKDCNERLLAITELQKMLVLKEQQSAWLLKQVYYKDMEKVSKNVRKIICYVKNIKWAGQFLLINTQQIGFVQSTRYLQLVFSMLKTPERKQQAIYFHFQALIQGLVSIIDVIAHSQECLFMNMICLVIFYDSSLESDYQRYHKRLASQWQQIKQKCRFYMTNNVSIILDIIASILNYQINNLEASSLSEVFTETFKYLSHKQNPLTKYYAKFLFFISKKLKAFVVIETILSFLGAFNQYNHNKIENILIQSSFNTQIELNDYMEQELENDEQRMIRGTLSVYIQEIFTKYYHQLVKEYCKTQTTTQPLFYFLIPLLNYYNSTKMEIISQWVANNLQNVIDMLGKSINNLTTYRENRQIVKDSVMCIQFLIKYKALIPIPLLVHVCQVLQQVSVASSSLSPFCFNFIQNIWENIAYLNFEQLTNFMLQHIIKLNQNEWDHKFQYFSCFLHLTKSLEQQYQYFSHFLATDSLFKQSIKACQVMVSLLEQIPRDKVNHQLVILLIQLINSFIKGIEVGHQRQFHHNMKIQFFRKIIQSLQIYNIESANIVLLDVFVQEKLPISLHSQFLIQLNDLADLEFKVSMFLNQIAYLQQNLSISAFHYQRLSLYRELEVFLASIGKEKLNWLRQSKLWSSIEGIKNQSNLPAIEN